MAVSMLALLLCLTQPLRCTSQHVGMKEYKNLDMAIASSEFGKRILKNSHHLLSKTGCSGQVDADHIVPRSRGGADHPSNYFMMCNTTNKSFGKVFSVDKCALVGASQCMVAIYCSAVFGGNIPKGASSKVVFNNNVAEETVNNLLSLASPKFKKQLVKARAAAKTTCSLQTMADAMPVDKWKMDSSILQRDMLDSKYAATVARQCSKTTAKQTIRSCVIGVCKMLKACRAEDQGKDVIPSSSAGAAAQAGSVGGHWDL